MSNSINIEKEGMAVVGKILSITSIPGADRIKAAKVVCGKWGAWQGIVGLKEDFELNEKVVVFMPDAVLPPCHRWEFMEAHKWRVKMRKFKGVPSEVLIIKWDLGKEIGADITKDLGILKYEKVLPASMTGIAKGDFPSYIPKTDEENYQKFGDSFLNGAAFVMESSDWYITEKADGTSCTVWKIDGELRVASRNLELEKVTKLFGKPRHDVYWEMVDKYKLAEALHEGEVIQFEIVGPGIQSNPMGLVVNQIRVFNYFKLPYKQPYSKLKEFCEAYDLPMAKYIGDNECIFPNYENLSELADIKYDNGKPAEGVVVRAKDQSWSFKIINLNYEK